MDTSGILSGLQSGRTTERLDRIAKLRSYGVGEHVDLPQLIVCGDQSAGKSSVLEGITGLPFPKKDGLCTKFATEIMLTHDEGALTTQARIIPSAARSGRPREELMAYERSLDDLSELPHVITDAGTLMGLRGFGRTQGAEFAADVLRIKISGPTRLNLTIIDLPGLISATNAEQGEDDVRMVHDLVDSYVQNPRAIILAVVQASNDIANQSIIQKSKKFDRTGERTVGIITKPDLVNIGTEGRVAALSKNQDEMRLKLGFFLLKNPSPSEVSELSNRLLREQNEESFFARSPWNQHQLHKERLGASNLRGFLQQLLDDHIGRELPKVREEIRTLLGNVERDLSDMGHERPTSMHIRMFLSRFAMRFHTLTAAALRGDYHATDAAFFANPSSDRQYVRLRAFVHKANTCFANELRLHGATFKVGHTPPSSPNTNCESSSNESDTALPDPYADLRLKQKTMSEADVTGFVMEIYQSTRGRELPGHYNHVLLTELFHMQSDRWKSFASVHLSHLIRSIETFVADALTYLNADGQMRREMSSRISESLAHHCAMARSELDRLCEDKDGQPITYNHYFTDNVQNSRHETTRGLLRKALKEASVEEYNKKLHISNTTVDAEKLLGALQRRVLVDMDEQACSEAWSGLNAYYKVARKTFVDNVCVQVVERHLLRNLTDVFSPEMVIGFSDDELHKVGGESETTQERRKELQNLHSRLSTGLRDLQGMSD